MVVAFLYYLHLQGYKEHDITILTPYLGQLSKLRTGKYPQVFFFKKI